MKFPARKVAPAAVLCHAIVDHHPGNVISSAAHDESPDCASTSDVAQRLLITWSELGNPAIHELDSWTIGQRYSAMVLSPIDWRATFASAAGYPIDRKGCRVG